MAACGGEVVAPAADRAAAIEQNVGASYAAASQGAALAKAIAKGLSSPGSRARLLSQWRGSKLSDHKLRLDETLSKAENSQLAEFAARELDIAPTSMASHISQLGALDFYVPFREHRNSWRASDDVLVAYSSDPDSPTLEAYDINGASHVLRLSDGAPARPLIIIHRKEPTVVATGQDANQDPSVIESKDIISVAPVEEQSDDPPGSGGFNPGVYVTQFYSYRSDGWWGALEMEFRTSAWEGDVVYQGSSLFSFSGGYCSLGVGTAALQPQALYTNLLIMISPGVTNPYAVGCSYQSTPRGYEVLAIESDGGLNLDDDDFGRRFFYPGTIPFGAVLSQRLPYYSMGGTPTNGELSIELQVETR